MSVRTRSSLIGTLLLITLVVPSAAHAAGPSSSAGLRKPPAVSHPDVAPAVPGNMPASEAGIGKLSSPDAVPGMSRLIGGNAGTNLVSFESFKDGDIIVVLDPRGLTGHAGLFDSRYYASNYSFAVWSANTSPSNGVQREQCLKYRANDEAFGLRVSGGSAYRAAARNFAAKQVGKPYNILAPKTDLSSFYCSKVVWAAWRYTLGVDLDADGGYWVWPVDLINSPHTQLFGYWG